MRCRSTSILIVCVVARVVLACVRLAGLPFCCQQSSTSSKHWATLWMATRAVQQRRVSFIVLTTLAILFCYRRGCPSWQGCCRHLYASFGRSRHLEAHQRLLCLPEKHLVSSRPRLVSCQRTTANLPQPLGNTYSANSQFLFVTITKPR